MFFFFYWLLLKEERPVERTQTTYGSFLYKRPLVSVPLHHEMAFSKRKSKLFVLFFNKYMKELHQMSSGNEPVAGVVNMNQQNCG